MEQSIQFMTSISLIIFGLSYLTSANDWIMWIEHLERQGRRASLTLGSVNLLIGSFILAFHWIWQGWPLLVSLIGVIALVKAGTYLLCPGWLPAKLSKIHKQLPGWLKISGLILIIAGIVIGYYWGQQVGYWEDWQFINNAEGIAYVD